MLQNLHFSLNVVKVIEAKKKYALNNYGYHLGYPGWDGVKIDLQEIKYVTCGLDYSGSGWVAALTYFLELSAS
jgi:hypothetical protein